MGGELAETFALSCLTYLHGHMASAGGLGLGGVGDVSFDEQNRIELERLRRLAEQAEVLRRMKADEKEAKLRARVGA